jgi:hypothetical protein
LVINGAGTGYTVGSIVQINYPGGGFHPISPNNGQAIVTSVSGTGAVTGLTLLTLGKNYPGAATNVSTDLISGTGSGLTVNIIGQGLFEELASSVQDPTQLTASLTTYAQRFYLSQTQKPSVCRHMQVLVSFGGDTVKNELLSLTIYGGYSQET